MGRLSYRQADDMGASLRPLSVGIGPIAAGLQRVLGLLVMTALAWACGSESVCPSGTAGSTCIPTDDLGAAPDVPTSSRDRANESASEADVLEIGTDDAEAPEQDSTTQFMREAPDALRPTPACYAGRGGGDAERSGHVMERERAARCAALTGDHVEFRGAPYRRSPDRVGWGPIEWRQAA